MAVIIGILLGVLIGTILLVVVFTIRRFVIKSLFLYWPLVGVYLVSKIGALGKLSVPNVDAF